jgi:hypothetical protein
MVDIRHSPFIHYRSGGEVFHNEARRYYMKAKVAEKNDLFRKTLGWTGKGQLVTTQGVTCLDKELKVSLFKEIIAFNSFTEDNDPYGEHDFGKVSVSGEDYFWKIDYYADNKCESGYDWVTHNAENRAEDTAHRVLTIMLADEY